MLRQLIFPNFVKKPLTYLGKSLLQKAAPYQAHIEKAYQDLPEKAQTLTKAVAFGAVTMGTFTTYKIAKQMGKFQEIEDDFNQEITSGKENFSTFLKEMDEEGIVNIIKKIKLENLKDVVHDARELQEIITELQHHQYFKLIYTHLLKPLVNHEFNQNQKPSSFFEEFKNTNESTQITIIESIPRESLQARIKTEKELNQLLKMLSDKAQLKLVEQLGKSYVIALTAAPEAKTHTQLTRKMR